MCITTVTVSSAWHDVLKRTDAEGHEKTMEHKTPISDEDWEKLEEYFADVMETNHAWKLIFYVDGSSTELFSVCLNSNCKVSWRNQQGYHMPEWKFPDKNYHIRVVCKVHFLFFRLCLRCLSITMNQIVHWDKHYQILWLLLFCFVPKELLSKLLFFLPPMPARSFESNYELRQESHVTAWLSVLAVQNMTSAKGCVKGD